MVVHVNESADTMLDRTESDWHDLVVDYRQQISQTKTQLGQLTLMAEKEAVIEKLDAMRQALNNAELQLEKFEPILKANPQRFVIFPIIFDNIWAEYKKAMGSFWTAEEIILTDDIEQWAQKSKSNGNDAKLTLSDNDRFFIKHILAFFASADGIVNENLASRFYSEVQIAEARCFISGTKISMANGTSLPIENVKVGDKILGWNSVDNCVVPSKVTCTKHHVNKKSCLKLTLEDGRTITSTPDHRYLTSDGTFIEAQKLIANSSRVSVTCDFALATPPMSVDNNWSLSLGKFGNLDTVNTLDKTLAFARLTGFILTDGSCAANKQGDPTLRCYVATNIGKEMMLDDIELLCGKRPKVGMNVYSINIPEEFGRAIYNTDPIAFAIGNRIDKPYCLPTFITSTTCPLVVVREFLGGLFGGDGNTTGLCGTQDKLKFINVGFSSSKTEKHVPSLQVGFNIIIDLLKKFDIDSHIVSLKTNRQGTKQLILECNGGSNSIKFAKEIGFRYDPHKMVKLAIGATYYRMRDSCGEFYKDVILTAHDIREKTGGRLWKTARLAAIDEVRIRRKQIGSDDQCLPSINAITSKKALTSNRGIFMGAHSDIEEWTKSIDAHQLLRDPDDIKGSYYSIKPTDKGLPIIQLKVMHIDVAGDHETYDLSVEDPINSFVAEGAVVHNCFYGFQIMMENIHGEVYSLLIDSLIKDEDEKTKLFESVKNFPAIKKLADWAMKWMHSDLPFNQRLIAFACVEGILFSGPFCAIFWLKKRGLLPGLTFSNELISRDENLHMLFACLLNSLLEHPATHEVITEIVTSAVELQKEFIIESLPCNLIGMNAVEMSKYIEYVGDHLLVLLGCDKFYGTPNPFEWMDLISANNKTNFFEKKVGEYNKAKFNKANLKAGNKTAQTTAITLLEDF
jgi:ribonucleotide reductase beta subunit family protein with ferritin-like domain/intein/homing endonuclease